MYMYHAPAPIFAVKEGYLIVFVQWRLIVESVVDLYVRKVFLEDSFLVFFNAEVAYFRIKSRFCPATSNGTDLTQED